jgi:hypothetical protein
MILHGNMDNNVYILWVYMPMMMGKILAYRLKEMNTAEKNYFCKHFLGQETSSNRGRYRYRRKGLLDHIPHRKLIRGVLIIPSGYSDEVVDFLHMYNAEVYIRNVVLTSDDIRILGLDKKV